MSERETQHHSPKKPTLEQQLNVWVYTHPEPDETTLIMGGEYSPRRILAEVREGTEFGQEMVQFLEESAQRFNVPKSAFIQDSIETNLRGIDKDPVMPSLEELNLDRWAQLSAIKRAYSRGVMGLPGVVGIGVEYVEEEVPGLAIYVKSEDIVDKMPTEIEGAPVKTIVTGVIRAY